MSEIFGKVPCAKTLLDSGGPAWGLSPRGDLKKESGTNVNGDKKDCGLCSGEMQPVATVEALHLKSTRISALLLEFALNRE